MLQGIVMSPIKMAQDGQSSNKRIRNGDFMAISPEEEAVRIHHKTRSSSLQEYRDNAGKSPSDQSVFLSGIEGYGGRELNPQRGLCKSDFALKRSLKRERPRTDKSNTRVALS
jgi:hypothetical protein